MSDVIDAGLCYSTFHGYELVLGLYDYDIHMNVIVPIAKHLSQHCCVYPCVAEGLMGLYSAESYPGDLDGVFHDRCKRLNLP